MTNDKSRHRAWTFTLFEKSDTGAVFGRPPVFTPAGLLELPERAYCIYQLEKCPDSGRRHLQGYIHLEHPKGLGGCKALFGADWQHVHLEVARGSAASNISYCSKEESQLAPPVIYGEAPVGQGKRTDIIEFCQEIITKRGRIDFENPENARFLLLHPHGLQRLISVATRPARAIDEPLTVVYIWGAPGSGKSFMARDLCLGDNNDYSECYFFPIMHGTLWADGYRGQSFAVLDDFTSEVFSIESLLRLTDRYYVDLPVKGSHVLFAPQILFITSNYSPDELYPNSYRQHGALLRRLNVIVNLEKTVCKITKWRI